MARVRDLLPHERRTQPERIVLPAAPGSDPERPTVRIFLGTEPAQFRAERAFVWSVHTHRDPGRRYEIHLMRNLPGYRRWFWTTQFTNYRFAVPAYAGYRGRAIYNDTDQVYLSDPAELFDLDMGEHGYLTLSERDTSVMLIDCERMARVWTLEGAQRRRKHALLDRAAAVPGLAGPLPPAWNARDYEVVEGESKCVHFTTLHLQPWRPFPERFVYRENPHGRLFFDLEESADRHGFQVFDRQSPSEAWRALLETPEAPPARDAGGVIDEATRALVRRAKARTLLRFVPGTDGSRRTDAAHFETEELRELSLRRLDAPRATTPRADGVVCVEGLEEVPAEDVGWVVDELFRAASDFVLAAIQVRGRPARRLVNPPAGTVRTADWWVRHFEAAARRHPDLHWQLVLAEQPRFRERSVRFRQGGRFPGDALPHVWVLTDSKPGHVTQSVGLVGELGWPYERIQLELTPLAELPNPWLGATRLGLTRRSAREVASRTPDVVIAAGRRAAPVARWIRERSRGRTRIVQLGREGVFPAEEFDLAVVPSYAGLLPHPNRMVVAAPLSRARRPLLEEARTRWERLFEGKPAPRIGLLVGGHAPNYRLTPERARALGRDVRAMAERAGGSVFVTTSRRTTPAAVRALEEELGGAAHFHRWSHDQPGDANPFLGYLALADAFVVTGESASMLADACSTGKPVFVYDVPRGIPGPKGWPSRVLDRVVGAVVARANHAPKSRRGFTRPQRGLEWLCSQLLARGWVRPTCDFAPLHRTLLEQGLARPFDGRFARFRTAPSRDLARVAGRLRRMMGVPENLP